MNDGIRPSTGDDDLRKKLAVAIFNPGATEGYKDDRTLTEWQADAVMRVLTAQGRPVGVPGEWLNDGAYA